MQKNNKGFTLIELLVVIAIIGLLSTLSVVALNNARQKSRDAKRVADVKQMQTALELYFNDCSGYPPMAVGDATGLTAVADCAAGVGFSDFMAQVPSNPSPMTDGGCANQDYQYASCNSDGSTCAVGQTASYYISYCLGSTINGITGGVTQTANPAAMQ